MRALNPYQEWSTEAHLLALAVDALRGANWQRSTDPRSPRPPPKPIARPGVQAPKPAGLPLNELRRVLHPESEGGE